MCFKLISKHPSPRVLLISIESWNWKVKSWMRLRGYNRWGNFNNIFIALFSGYVDQFKAIKQKPLTSVAKWVVFIRPWSYIRPFGQNGRLLGVFSGQKSYLGVFRPLCPILRPFSKKNFNWAYLFSYFLS